MKGTRVNVVGRAAAAGALLVAVLAIVLIVVGNSPSYKLRANFQNASGLVPGNVVLMGPAQVGSVDSIGLTPNGAAQVTITVNSDVAPLHQGTVARIYEDSLSGIASKYIELQPGPSAAPPIGSGGLIPESHTYSEV